MNNMASISGINRKAGLTRLNTPDDPMDLHRFFAPLCDLSLNFEACTTEDVENSRAVDSKRAKNMAALWLSLWSRCEWAGRYACARL